MRIDILDHGYVELVEYYGSDERIIEAARMSTNKGFEGWYSGYQCNICAEVFEEGAKSYYIKKNGYSSCCGTHESGCMLIPMEKDLKLLKYLYENNHSTPFEMAGMIIEVMAPIFVFREWHRHRTQSYNEMSARYVPLPDLNYIPDVNILMERANAKTKNKQAQGKGVLEEYDALEFIRLLKLSYENSQKVYEYGLESGVPKELARLSLPVARYSKMRAAANLRNWIAFLTLRQAQNAQWEIRQYADAVGELISQAFPHTWDLYIRNT